MYFLVNFSAFKFHAFINWCTCVCVCVCVCSYVIWYQKGYQEFDDVVSATTTKVKGIAVTNYSALNSSVAGGFDGIRIWDVADYVVPPQVVASVLFSSERQFAFLCCFDVAQT